MTARDRIRAKPGPVQVIIKAKMTKDYINALINGVDADALLATSSNLERCGEAALAWWEQEVMAPSLQIDPHASEVTVAEELVAGLRQQEVWGKILRGAAE